MLEAREVSKKERRPVNRDRNWYHPFEKGYRPDGPIKPPEGPPRVQSGDIKPDNGQRPK